MSSHHTSVEFAFPGPSPQEESLDLDVEQHEESMVNIVKRKSADA